MDNAAGARAAFAIAASTISLLMQERLITRERAIQFVDGVIGQIEKTKPVDTAAVEILEQVRKALKTVKIPTQAEH